MAKHNSPQAIPGGSGEINIGEKERMVSAVGGIVLLASAVRIGTSRPAAAIGSTLAGLYLLFRGSTGHCHVNAAIGRNGAAERSKPLVISETIKVNRPKDQIYNFWRKLENLPEFISHLKSVKEINETESHWQAQIPGGIGSISWDAEIIDDRPGKMISWRSKPGAIVDNAGEVTFKSSGENGTEIHAVISYAPPAGDIGRVIANWLNNSFEEILRKDLAGFKHKIETEKIGKVS